MKGYFEFDIMQATLRSIARRWIETPFVPHAAIRGAGVDCVQLCAEIYKEAGAIQKFDPPVYTMDGGRHLRKSLVVEWLEQSGRFFKVEKSKVGDILCFDMGRVEHHAGIQVTEHTFVHAARRYGVIESNLQDPTHKDRLTAIYRPLAL